MPKKSDSERCVFVTVGTTKFDELVQGVDSLEFLTALQEKGYSKLVIQKGNGNYCPHVVVPLGQTHAKTQGIEIEYFEYTPSLGDLISSAALVISHAGSGSIFETLTVGKPLVVVPNPRLMDNHQVELGDQLAAMGHLVCSTPDELPQAVRNLDPSKLAPYEKGRPEGIARVIDGHMGFRNLL